MKSRMKGFTIFLSCVFCLSLFCSFSSQAASVYLTYPEPACTDFNGYLVVECRDSDGESHIFTFVWYYTYELYGADTASNVIPLKINIKSSSVTFSTNPPYSDAFIWCFGYIGMYTEYGNYDTLTHINDKTSFSFTKSWSTLSVYSYFVNGANSAVTFYKSGTVNPPDVVFKGLVGGSDVISRLDKIVSSNSSIQSTLQTYEPMLYDRLLTIDNRLISMLSTVGVINDTTSSIFKELNNIRSVLYSTNEILSNGFHRVMSSMDEFKNILFNKSEEDQAASSAYSESSKNQSSSINQATKDSETSKVDISSASSSVDQGIDFDSLGSKIGMIAAITYNPFVETMLLCVFCVALIAFVLFGKR